MTVKPSFKAKIPPLTRMASPDFDEAAARVYVEALEALEADRVPYLAGGALALNAHTGIWRDTKDLDLFVKPEDATRSLDVLRKAGFQTEVVYESWLGKAWKGDVFVDLIWRNANALLPVRDSWLADPPHVDALGRSIPVLPLEELLASKMMVMNRYRYDGADMLHILHVAGPRVDWEKLGRICGEHAGLMLAHMHTYRWAYPAWAERVPDEAIALFTRIAAEAASTFGPFRGRLIDIQSFHVDVAEWGMPDPHRHALERIFGEVDGHA
ncbi:MAG TPA: hypothetical protein VFH78_08235 [Candidatus Thermoplasmatota archaeon]|nr:hypothetical protein [Candidatus Thermoplasmatota archaeon]